MMVKKKSPAAGRNENKGVHDPEWSDGWKRAFDLIIYGTMLTMEEIRANPTQAMPPRPETSDDDGSVVLP
jgi:hypothetical protein